MLWELREESGVEMAGKLERGGLWRGDGSMSGALECLLVPQDQHCYAMGLLKTNNME